MPFGPWFERGSDDPKIREGLTFLVDEAIDILSAHFGMDINNDELWDKIDLPIVQIGRDPGYYDNIIYLPDNIKRGDSSIGHEVAHWFLGILNPNYRILTRNHPVVINYLEPIADIYGLIYASKVRGLQN